MIPTLFYTHRHRYTNIFHTTRIVTDNKLAKVPIDLMTRQETVVIRELYVHKVLYTLYTRVTAAMVNTVYACPNTNTLTPENDPI